MVITWPSYPLVSKCVHVVCVRKQAEFSSQHVGAVHISDAQFICMVILTVSQKDESIPVGPFFHPFKALYSWSFSPSRLFSAMQVTRSINSALDGADTGHSYMGLLGNPSCTLMSVWLTTYFSDNNPSSFPQKAHIITFSKCHIFFFAIITSKTNGAENMATELGPGFLRQHNGVVW